MSERDRSDHLGIVVIGVVTFLMIFGMIGYFQGIDKNLDFKHEEYAKQEKAEVAKNIEGDCLNVGVLSQECTEEKIETYRTANDESEDLYAQKQMAYWAKWLLILTALSTGISVLALLYVARTLDLTKSTLNATRKMAQDTQRIGDAQVQASNGAVIAAQDANQLTREAMQSTNRPFIVVRNGSKMKAIGEAVIIAGNGTLSCIIMGIPPP